MAPYPPLDFNEFSTNQDIVEHAYRYMLNDDEFYKMRKDSSNYYYALKDHIDRLGIMIVGLLLIDISLKFL